MSAARMALAIRTRSLSVSVTLGPMTPQPGPRQAPASEHLKPILGGSISLPSVQSEGTQAKTPAIPSASGRTSLPEAKLGSVWEVQVRRATRQNWSAVINGVVAVPVMIVMMLMSAEPKVMGPFVVTGWLRAFGWGAAPILAAAVIAMLATSF